ncbi:hypothetical protein Vadar_010819 [Vaccinium darrowii]|uniref:Uncharacterized protein n=1 Tax=Vaccinium darrowii TaxID=229202 RepID=A0ACB7XGR4_9ERIC|nr:hypothetical protein Vadar_010819 [Vaccinium darrowii]
MYVFFYIGFFSLCPNYQNDISPNLTSQVIITSTSILRVLPDDPNWVHFQHWTQAYKNFTELDKLKRWKISHAVAKLLIGGLIIPEKVLVLDSVQSRNFRGKLSPDETIAFKLETLQQRKGLGDGCGDSSLLKGLDYFPSGSVVDGLSAALLGQCQMKRIKGSLCVSWPEFGVSVATFVKTLLLKNVLPELENGFDSNGEDVFGFGFGKVRGF